MDQRVVRPVIITQNRGYISSPIQPDEGDVVGCQPTQHVQAYAAVAINYNNPSWLFSVGWEEPMFLDGLGIMGKTVFDEKAALIHPQADPVAGQDERLVGMPRRTTSALPFSRERGPIPAAVPPRCIVQVFSRGSPICIDVFHA